MLSINPLSQTKINGYELTLAEVYQTGSESDADIYTLIKTDEALNTYIYIPEEETHPIPIEDNENSINTYNCANCGNVKQTENHYGCTWSSSDNSIRNKDVLLCNDCKNELETIYETALDESLSKFVADII